MYELFDDYIQQSAGKDYLMDFDEVYHVDRSHISKPGHRHLAKSVGNHGGRPRCYNLRMQYYNCLKTAKIPDLQCMLYQEDLYECRFRTKEYRRLERILQEMGTKAMTPRERPVLRTRIKTRADEDPFRGAYAS